MTIASATISMMNALNWASLGKDNKHSSQCQVVTKYYFRNAEHKLEVMFYQDGIPEERTKNGIIHKGLEFKFHRREMQ